MALCNLCTSIDFSNLPPPPSAQGWDYRMGVSVYDASWCEYVSTDRSKLRTAAFTSYHQSLEELETAKERCILCRRVATAIERAAVMIKPSRPTFELYISRPESTDSFAGFLVLSPAEEDPCYRCYVVACFGFCVSDTSPLRSRFNGRTINPDPTHPIVLERMQCWIQECGRSHSHSAHDRPELPSRILDLNCNSAEIRIFETQGAKADYAALSHCWGLCRQSILTQQTLAKFISGVSERSLPQTFQDAVLITRKLGLRYLWIDSLCILQDDADDWERESERMASVYGQAFITIAASRAGDDSEGFLGLRPLRTYTPLPFPADGVQRQILAFEKHMEYEISFYSQLAMEKEPLTDRGWTLQERYLSPRTLHFGISQISFECDDIFTTEDGTFAKSPDLPFATSLKDFSDSPGSGFRRIAGQYSRRRLTMEEDKLPALAGIATKFAKTRQLGTNRPECYLAGLWYSNLVKDLCWFRTRSSPLKPRPQRYRGPSWSWASMDGAITYLQSDETTKDLIVVVDAQVSPRSVANPYGKVEAGWIQCCGLLDPVFQRTDGLFETAIFGNLSSAYLSVDVEEYQSVEKSPSTIQDMHKEELFFLPIELVKCDNHPYLFFLLTVKMTIGDDASYPQFARGRRHFKRVGAGYMLPLKDVTSTWKADKVEEVFLF